MTKKVLWVVVFVVSLRAVVHADLSALLTFTLGTATATKVEVLRNGTFAADVTTSYYPCGANACAVVAQPNVAGTYQYSVRVTDNIGGIGVSNQLPLVVPSVPNPSCQSVSLVSTTGTPTPVIKPTPTP